MRPLILIILDGWGYSSQQLGNAIATAETPTMDDVQANFPMLLLQASGKSVGLNWGEPGNSEVGHLTIGAGRTIFQYSTRINSAIETGAFFENPALVNAAFHARQNNSTLHLIGLLGSGTVHASFDHLLALIDFAKKQGVPRLALHLFSDGKDSGLKESVILIKKLQDHLAKTGLGAIASIIGRQDAMDRDNNWERTQHAYDLWVNGIGEQTAQLTETITTYHQQGIDDSHLPAILADANYRIRDHDAIIFFNFREDSMRQITRAFIEPGFDKFPRKGLQDLFIVLMTQYIENPGIALNVAFPLPEINNGLSQVMSERGLKQLHIAETEKYAHAIYFFNCLRNGPFEGEADILIDSYKNHQDHPSMRASEIADRFLEEFEKDLYNFTIINFANADILSHLGSLELAVQGVRAIDMALARMIPAILAKGGIVIMTSDHGNAESLIYKKSGDIETKHNLNPVPWYLVANEYRRARTPEELASAVQNSQGILSDVAPTILELMGIEKPAEMTGESLLRLLL